MYIKLIVAGIRMAIVLLPALYVLSSGPADVLAREGYISTETWAMLYTPLIVACTKNQPAWTLLNDYWAWWEKLFPIRHPVKTEHFRT
jgi:hypothetical protein